jgi:hypothetical protein
VNRGECTINAATAYIVDRKLPKPGTHCAAIQPSTVESKSTRW